MAIQRNHYLEQHVQRWYYVRRVLSRNRHFDTRRTVKTALHADSITVAHDIRDRLMDRDEHFWETELAKQTGGDTQESIQLCRYRAARRRAVAVSFDFKPLPKLTKLELVEQLVERVKTLEEDDTKLIDRDAVLGAIEPLKTLSAMRLSFIATS